MFEEEDEDEEFEWIDVDSDRLQTAGRFANEADKQEASTSPTQGRATMAQRTTTANGEDRSKSGAGAKRTGSNVKCRRQYNLGNYKIMSDARLQYGACA